MLQPKKVKPRHQNFDYFFAALGTLVGHTLLFRKNIFLQPIEIYAAVEIWCGVKHQNFFPSIKNHLYVTT